jgi:hypothetical protein
MAAPARALRLKHAEPQSGSSTLRSPFGERGCRQKKKMLGRIEQWLKQPAGFAHDYRHIASQTPEEGHETAKRSPKPPSCPSGQNLTFGTR